MGLSVVLKEPTRANKLEGELASETGSQEMRRKTWVRREGESISDPSGKEESLEVKG